MEKFIGCMVSLDCGETLGTYQGQVIAINPVEGSITIVQPYRNGIPYNSPQVTLRSQDIKHLEIVRSSDEAKGASHVINRRISFQSTSDSQTNDSIKSFSADANAGQLNQASAQAFTQPEMCPSVQHKIFGGITGSAPLKHRLVASIPVKAADSFQDNYNAVMSGNLVDCLNKLRVNDGSQTLQSAAKYISNGKKQSFQSPSFADAGQAYVTPVENRFSGRKRTSSASEVHCIQQSRRAHTPRKADRQQQKNNECFNDSEVFDDEFDFEKNLAMFDKHAVFEEIEKERENGVCSHNSQASRSEQKYRCDENILQTSKAAYRQIKLVNGGVNSVCSKKKKVPTATLR